MIVLLMGIRLNQVVKKPALARLLTYASQFTQVAREASEDKARQGGDLGWKTRQEVVSAFADAAFSLQVPHVHLKPFRSN